MDWSQPCVHWYRAAIRRYAGTMRLRPVLLVAALSIGCGHRAPPESTAAIAPAPPRSLSADGYGARVHLTEGPGYLIDGNAPPPPPGVTLGRHPAVHGDCMGDPLGCSRAGTAVRAGASFDEVAAHLEAAGFEVTASSTASTAGSASGSTSDEPPAPASPAFAVHEWGLLDLQLASGSAEIAAGPGRPTPPAPPHHGPPSPPSWDGPSVRKPVLYVHLGDGVESLTFSASVHIPDGLVVEHWPASRPSGGDVTWEGIVARRASCPVFAQMPRRAAPAGCGTSDGYCEVDDLPSYRTYDAACLSYAGADAPLLFYRGAVQSPSSPLTVSGAADGTVRVTLRAGVPLSGGLHRITRSTADARGLPAVRIRSMAPPMPGASIAIPSAEMAADARALRSALAADLASLGLTDDEARAFLEAWIPELVERPRVADALIFWLPRQDIDAIAALHFEPAPTALHRAMLVRLDLGVVPVADSAAGTRTTPRAR